MVTLGPRCFRRSLISRIGKRLTKDGVPCWHGSCVALVPALDTLQITPYTRSFIAAGPQARLAARGHAPRGRVACREHSAACRGVPPPFYATGYATGPVDPLGLGRV